MYILNLGKSQSEKQQLPQAKRSYSQAWNSLGKRSSEERHSLCKRDFDD